MGKEVKNKKESKHFFKDFKAELKKVIWPTPKQLVNNTVAVITIVLITGVIVFALDFAFESINTFGVNKLKDIVGYENVISSEMVNEVVEENTQTTNEEVETSENVSE